MKLKLMKCPNCEASIDNDEEIEVFFCKYCGSRIIIEELTAEELNAKIKIKEMQHIEKMKEKEFAENNAEWERFQKTAKETNKNLFIIVGALWIVAIVVFIILSNSEKFASDKQERELETVVEEVIVDIENGDYSSARIKAESVYYTADWSDEVEEKWDAIRKRLLEEIDKAEGNNGEKVQ